MGVKKNKFGTIDAHVRLSAVSHAGLDISECIYLFVSNLAELEINGAHFDELIYWLLIIAQWGEGNKWTT